MPVSISSKTRVPTSSLSAAMVLKASMMRESSPPEAVRLRGLSGSPALTEMRKRTRSRPEAEKNFSASSSAGRAEKSTCFPSPPPGKS